MCRFSILGGWAVLFAALLALDAAAQSAPLPAVQGSQEPWQLLNTGTTASLRGIHALNEQVAWASGTEGTVLRTTDGGAHWQPCATPDGNTDGATLDLRGVQAWDAETAMVMASGPGDKSRLYKTTDGCKSWTLTLKNAEKDGFWDVLAFQHGDFGYAIGDAHTGVLLGDPVADHFDTRAMLFGHGWFIDDAGCKTTKDQSAFAASNSSAFVFGSRRTILGTGGKLGARVYISPLALHGAGTDPCTSVSVPITGGSESSGIFSLFFRSRQNGVAVGGDYTKPNQSAATAAFTSDGGLHWTAAEQPPHGYRSSVQWSNALNLWFSAGTNGSDVSRDGGRTWQKLDDGNWNALSLPFVVGPKGRIAKLAPEAKF